VNAGGRGHPVAAARFLFNFTPKGLFFFSGFLFPSPGSVSVSLSSSFLSIFFPVRPVLWGEGRLVFCYGGSGKNLKSSSGFFVSLSLPVLTLFRLCSSPARSCGFFLCSSPSSLYWFLPPLFVSSFYSSSFCFLSLASLPGNKSTVIAGVMAMHPFFFDRVKKMKC